MAEKDPFENKTGLATHEEADSDLVASGDADPSADDTKESSEKATQLAESKDSNDGKDNKGLKDTVKAAQATHAAIEGVAKTLMMLNLINFLKNMFSALAAGVTSLLSAIWGAITGTVMSVVGAVASLVGVSTAVAGAIVSGIAGAVALGIATIIDVAVTSNQAVRDTRPDCGDDVQKAVDAVKGAGEGGAFNTNAQQEKTAKEVYSVFKGLGWSDIQIAGALGNAQVESMLDPTTVEGVYGEPFAVGPRTQAAYEDMEGHFRNVLQPAYAAKRISLDVATYENGGNWSIGVGLFQITGGREKNMGAFAKANGREWSDLGTQLAFHLSQDDPARVRFLTNWKDHPEESPESAAYTFARDFEGNTSVHMPERMAYAAQWYARMGEWEADSDFANSVLSLAQTAKKAAGDNGAGGLIHNCYKAQKYDNSSIAKALLSYAWHVQEDSLMNDGTELYQRLITAIFPGDYYWQSCDRSVATGIRWAGADDDFPKGATSQQYLHMRTSDKWERVPFSNPRDWQTADKELQPGDILVLDGQHIWGWIGPKLIEETFAELGESPIDKNGLPYAIVHGSIGAEPYSTNSAGHHQSNVTSFPSRSPGVDSYPGKTGVYNGYEYVAFRNVKKETNSKYANLEAGNNPSTNGSGAADRKKSE